MDDLRGDHPPALAGDDGAELRRKLSERTRHLEAVLSSIAQGIVILDPDLRVVLTNSGLHDLVGYPRELGRPGTHVRELIRDRLEHGLFLPGEDEQGASVEELIERRLLAYRDLKRECYRHPFPGDRLVEISREKLSDGSIVCTFTDVTDQANAERELARQREALHEREKLSALGMLLAGVAHELNNPLSVVLGQAALIEETAVDPKLQDRARRVSAAAGRCARIIRTFLAIARESPPTRANVQLTDLVEQGLELVGYQLRRHQVKVVLELGSDLPPVTGDAAQLGQVIINLLVNACQALESVQGPRRLLIATRAVPTSREVELAVSDSGPGVPEELRTRIFDPFFTTKPIGVGTGIGLSLCHGVVTAHGGTIAVEAASAGGARFLVRLPQAEAALPAAEAAALEPGASAPARVLVVDDEPEIGEIVVEFLRSGGLAGEAVMSGEAALERLRAQPYDAVICDLRMPGLDGAGLYEAIGRERPGLPERFIFVTGDQLSDATRRFLMTCGRPCLEKPLLPEQVLRIVAPVVGRAHPGG